MENQIANGTNTEDIRCNGDCFECPFFLRLDICGYETSATLNREECV